LKLAPPLICLPASSSRKREKGCPRPPCNVRDWRNPRRRPSFPPSLYREKCPAGRWGAAQSRRDCLLLHPCRGCTDRKDRL